LGRPGAILDDLEASGRSVLRDRFHPEAGSRRTSASATNEGEPRQVVVQLAEDLGGYLCPVVGGPPADDRVEPFDHRLSVAPAQGPQLGAEPLPDSSLGRLARLDQRLAVVPADVESQEVEAFAEGDDARLVLVEGQTPGRQPVGELGLDLDRLLPGVAEDNEIIGLCRVACYAELGSGSLLVAGFGG
jgi:hypothetical protein